MNGDIYHILCTIYLMQKEDKITCIRVLHLPRQVSYKYIKNVVYIVSAHSVQNYLATPSPQLILSHPSPTPPRLVA